MTELSTTCCIAGGGPAGMMLGYLLARAGVDVIVLEKHADFLRDFRGDTIHPSTMQVMDELGLLDAFLALPHTEVRTLSARFGETEVAVADFSHLPVRAPYIAFMPQWDFLDFIADRGREHASFRLLMNTKAVGTIEEAGRIVGVRAIGGGGPITIRSTLAVACDGRGSDLRAAAGLEPRRLGAPMDVLWFRLSRAPDDSAGTFAQVARDKFFIRLNRGDYWQCAYVIPKGSLEKLRAAGLDAFKHGLAALAPDLRARIGEIADWDDIKLLSVAVDRLERWSQPGLLCLGDAAHAMSPIGGVGVNLAIQDAVAAANLLADPLREKRLADADLAAVQARREWPVKVTQAAQVAIQNRVIAPLLDGKGPTTPPWPIRLLGLFPRLRRLPARAIGMGVRPEHISPELAAAFDAARSVR